MGGFVGVKTFQSRLTCVACYAEAKTFFRNVSHGRILLERGSAVMPLFPLPHREGAFKP